MSRLGTVQIKIAEIFMVPIFYLSNQLQSNHKGYYQSHRLVIGMLSTAVFQVHSVGHIEIVFEYVYIYILPCKDFLNRFRVVSPYQFGSIYYLIS